jgi:hypothetical protein
VERQGLEADQSPPSSAEVKSGGAVRLLSQTFHGIVLNYLSTLKILPLLLTSEGIRCSLIHCFKGETKERD